MSSDREACGRCAMSTTVDVANAGQDDDNERAARDPYGEERIEVDERQLRTISPGAWLSRVSDRLGSSVDRLTWKR